MAPLLQHNNNNNKSKAATQPERSGLNTLNWLNLGFFIGNVVFTYGIGVLGWLGNGDNGEISAKYQVRNTVLCFLIVVVAVTPTNK
jgi:hypothetical protein